MVAIFETSHALVDDLKRIFLSFLGEMQIDHGGFEPGMPQIALDDAQVHPLLQQVGCIGMPEGVNGNVPFDDACLMPGGAESPLHAVDGHGGFGCGSFVLASAQGRENQDRISMGSPVSAKKLIGFVGYRHISVFGAFAPVNVDHHPFAIDVGYLEKKGLLEPQPAGVDGDQKGVVVKGADTAQDQPHLFGGENARQAAFLPRLEVFKQRPFLPKDMDEEKLQAAVADFHGGRRPIGFVPAIKEIFLQIVFGDLSGIFSTKFNEHSNGSGVAFLGAIAHTGQLQGLDGFVIPGSLKCFGFCHDASPLFGVGNVS